MTRDFKEAIKNRRSIYSIGNTVIVPKDKIKEMIEFALLHLPSPFNSQSTRIVLLLDKHHKRLWEITKETLKKLVPETTFKVTEEKINSSFASGYGTILFFEDKKVVEDLSKTFPKYTKTFPVWSQHTSGMHQFTMWVMLEDAGLGASLQHYNPVIDEEVKKEWKLDPNWELVAQIPFGNPLEAAASKNHEPLEKRLLIFE